MKGKLSIGDKVIMNDKYFVSDKNKGRVFEVIPLNYGRRKKNEQ